MNIITPKIVVIGGGAGGLELVTQLGHKLGKKKQADILLKDKNRTCMKSRQALLILI